MSEGCDRAPHYDRTDPKDQEIEALKRERNAMRAAINNARLLVERAITAHERGRKNAVADYLAQLSLKLAAAPRRRRKLIASAAAPEPGKPDG